MPVRQRGLSRRLTRQDGRTVMQVTASYDARKPGVAALGFR
jgi:hypothetical protein